MSAKKLLIAAACAAVCAAGAYAGLAWSAGNDIEALFKSHAEAFKANHPSVALSDIAIERGLFETNIRFSTRRKPDCALAAPKSAADNDAIFARLKVRHVPFDGGGFKKASFEAQASMAPDAATSNAPFAELRGGLDFSNAYSFSASGSPKSSKESSRSYDWPGFSGSGHGHAVENTFEFSAEAPGMSIRETDASNGGSLSVEAKKLTLRLASAQGTNKASLEADLLHTVGSTGDATSIGKFKSELQWQSGAAEIANGSLSISAAQTASKSVSAGDVFSGPFRLALSSNVKDGFASFEFGIKADDVAATRPGTKEVVKGSEDFVLEVSHLDSPALSKLSKALGADACKRAASLAAAPSIKAIQGAASTSPRSAGPGSLMASAEWTPLLFELAKNKPVVNFKKINTTTSLGQLNASAMIWIGDTPATQRAAQDIKPEDLFGALNAKIAVVFDEAMAANIVKINAETDPDAQNSWSALVEQGWMSKIQGGFQTSLEANAAGAKINGNPVSLPTLYGMALQSTMK